MTSSKKKIAIFGSTGSVGKNTLRVANHLADTIEVYGLAAHSNIDLLAAQIKQFHPAKVAVYNASQGRKLQDLFPGLKVGIGSEGLSELAADADVDLVVMAIVGMDALEPTVRAIEAKKNVALANKEVLVSAGELIMQLVKRQGTRLLPVDSEHSALFQCLDGKHQDEVDRVIITASGGPFRLRDSKDLENVTVEEALAHPTWRMGPKITIDSSTLINKILEVIEARWLFDLSAEKIEIVIHPQSIVHGFVEFSDGYLMAQMSEPHMIYPIQYALTYPSRKKGIFKPFDFMKNSSLEFFNADAQKFPALNLGQEALRAPGSFACFLNAANEVLVNRFLNKEITWRGIIKGLEKLLGQHIPFSLESLDAVSYVDRIAREEALTLSPL